MGNKPYGETTMTHRPIRWLVALSVIAFVSLADRGTAFAEPFFMVTSENVLGLYDTDDPSNLIQSVAITSHTFMGFDPIAGIDYRAATRGVYAIGASGRLYTLNGATGLVESRTLPLMHTGTNVGMAFEPVADLIRIVGTADHSLRVDPDTFTLVAMDDELAYAAGDSGVGVNPSVMGAVYANTQGGTTLYTLDSRRDVLAMEVPPNSGILHTVGPLGMDFTERGGFAISPSTGVAYAALEPASGANSFLYQINLATGAATNLGEIGGGVVITAMSVPAPGALALAVIGSVVMAIAHAIGRRGCRSRPQASALQSGSEGR